MAPSKGKKRVFVAPFAKLAWWTANMWMMRQMQEEWVLFQWQLSQRGNVEEFICLLMKLRVYFYNMRLKIIMPQMK